MICRSEGVDEAGAALVFVGGNQNDVSFSRGVDRSLAFVDLESWFVEHLPASVAPHPSAMRIKLQATAPLPDLRVLISVPRDAALVSDLKAHVLKTVLLPLLTKELATLPAARYALSIDGFELIDADEIGVIREDGDVVQCVVQLSYVGESLADTVFQNRPETVEQCNGRTPKQASKNPLRF